MSDFSASGRLQFPGILLAECYYCSDEGKWCKLCQQVFCKGCHDGSEKQWAIEEYLSPHEYYEREFLL